MVRIIYHSRSASLTAAERLAEPNLDRIRLAKSWTNPGSFLRTKAILRCKSMLLESTIWCFIKFPATRQSSPSWINESYNSVTLGMPRNMSSNRANESTAPSTSGAFFRL
jgi:hypothetical protein